MKISFTTQALILGIAFFLSCHAVHKPYNSKRFPDSEEEIRRDYENYYSLTDCQSGETIASIGAGNGLIEIQISYFVKNITWYLQEIDSLRLYQFEQVRAYHEKLLGTPIDANFNLVIGTEKTTHLPHGIFDRVLMINVFHEIETRAGIMMEIHQLLHEEGVLVIMERMGKIAGEIHGDCKYPKLVEPDFLNEMSDYGYILKGKQLGEEMSNLMFYTFSSTM